MSNKSLAMMKDSEAVLKEIVRRIVKLSDPKKVILFGSRARGDARPNSDYDLLVIKSSRQPRYRRSAPLYTALADLPVEVEVLVYTPKEVKAWRNVRQAFITTAIHEGRVLYEEKSGFSQGMATQGRRR